MATDAETARLVQTKLALAKKYTNLAMLASSKPKKQKYAHKAQKYQEQAAQLRH